MCVQATAQAARRTLRECHTDFQGHCGPFVLLAQMPSPGRWARSSFLPGSAGLCGQDAPPLLRCLCPLSSAALPFQCQGSDRGYRTGWVQLGFVFCSFLKRSVLRHGFYNTQAASYKNTAQCFSVDSLSCAAVSTVPLFCHPGRPLVPGPVPAPPLPTAGQPVAPVPSACCLSTPYTQGLWRACPVCDGRLASRDLHSPCWITRQYVSPFPG